MFILPSLAMAQGQVTRKPVTPPPTHKHSVNGPKDCTECNRLRKEKQRIEERRRKEQERIEEQQLLEEQRLAEERKRKEEEDAKLAEQKRIVDIIINNMVYVEGGTFTMGATSEQGSHVNKDEKPVHSVTLSSYYIGKYEVTQAEWKAIMGNNPSHFKGDNLPVENVSWEDCQKFISKLNSLTDKNLRLPTEAEWEFAARGGNSGRNYKYSGSDNIGTVAWYGDNSEEEIHEIGLKAPNELGIYDMSGNVSEWCQDWIGSYSSSSQTNPQGAVSGKYRVNRGGCFWDTDGLGCRVSARDCLPPKMGVSSGLRLVYSSFAHEKGEKLNRKQSVIDNLVNNMVYVSGGTFTMGATPKLMFNASSSEIPVHNVTLSSYYIGKYEVTQAEWKAVMGSNPSNFKGNYLPVENVSWNDCQEFICKLNSLTGKNFRLPTEAEWEFAARGGNKSRDYEYSGCDTLSSVAWYGRNSEYRTHSVGQKTQNELGVYDMSGNVLEWCQDWYGDYRSSSQTYPVGPKKGDSKVLRGGQYKLDYQSCRVSSRFYSTPTNHNELIGFRLAL